MCDKPAESHKWSTDHIESLDKVVEYTQHFTEQVDELAGALYADDKEGLERDTQKLVAQIKE